MLHLQSLSKEVKLIEGIIKAQQKENNMIAKTITQQSDYIGSIASGLCLIHCLSTPFLFITKACTISCCASAPMWWVALDFVFLVISFAAIYWSTKTTSKEGIKTALWLSWGLLAFVVVNEQVQCLPIPKMVGHLAAFALVGLHLYNMKYCQCQENECCTTQNLHLT